MAIPYAHWKHELQPEAQDTRADRKRQSEIIYILISAISADFLRSSRQDSRTCSTRCEVNIRLPKYDFRVKLIDVFGCH